ncbi:MAG: CRISPR-associated protein Csx11 [Candidatus Oleimicrobiaceae bacterium]
MTTPSSNLLQTLRDHRPLLLACEAIGWLHMAGKAKADFLRGHGGQPNNYRYEEWFNFENPPFPWSNLLQWAQNRYPLTGNAWPSSLTDFVSKHTECNPGLLGLLQAGHGMASGIEKNIPASTSGYLGQDVTHMWLSTAFGHPLRNLLQDLPEVLTPNGWQRLVGEIKRLLEDLQSLGQGNIVDVDPWWRWRESAIGSDGWLRKAFLSTLAETRVPNNDVTLWDQSYVAAALFKSAVAGAVLVHSKFPWNNQGLKQETRWRVLTVGFGTGHYEARAVKIGDWTGAQRDIAAFFAKVRRFIEVDIAVGSLVYHDDETLVFTFPGLSENGNVGLPDPEAEALRQQIEQEIDNLAQNRSFETPPLCLLSGSTRSFVGMVNELRKARSELAVPLHRDWSIQTPPGTAGHATRHVCPVCQVRLNEPKQSDRTDNVRKSRLCGVCEGRRRGRLDVWLQGEEETIWIDEVADENDRVALLTLSLEIEPWLEGERVDSLRAQSIAEWRRLNPVLGRNNRINNPIDLSLPFESLRHYIQQSSNQLDQNDLVLSSIQEGYRHANDWGEFFRKIVEDRADAPTWNALPNDEQRACWLTHQFFRKLPSPGRVYRFWRNAETFFQELFLNFGEIVSAHPNRWRVRRLALTPDKTSLWNDRETYTTRWRNAPLELLWLQDKRYFVTISNLVRGLNAQESKTALQNQSLDIFDENGQAHHVTVQKVNEPDRLGVYRPLIPLELSPRRFRVLAPLDRATACIEAAIARWQVEFARVWDRLPLRIGVVAFPRTTPFQAVIEAARNLEASLDDVEKAETWRVEEAKTREGITALVLKRPDGGHECRPVPVCLPDGREDVFYPYVQVEDRTLRFPHDFQHPNGQVYRHMSDLCRGDGICVWSGRIAALFLDTTARRFEQPRVWPLAEFSRMQEIWRLVCRTAPGMAALQGAWAELARQRTQWTDLNGAWLAGAEAQWLALVRAVLDDRWQASGAALDTLVEASKDGVLEWAIEWHLTWLKEKVEE